MKQQQLKYILIFLMILTGFIYKVQAQNIQVSAKLDQDAIKLGDQTKLHLIVHQPVKEHVNFPQLTDTLTSKIQIIGPAKLDTVLDQNNHKQATITQTYTITSFDAGSYNVPSFKFGSKDSVLLSNDVNLLVQQVKVDTTKAIYDIKQPFAVSYTFWDWLKDNWIWVVVVLVIILVIIGVVYYLKKRPKKEPVAPEIKVAIPPHVEALNRLKELRDRKLWQQGEVKEYHSELSDIIREYLEKRYVIKTQEKTTDEIFANLKYLSIADESRNTLRQILVLADLVKFAKEKPLPAENEQSMEKAIAFVSQTQQAPAPKESTEGGSGNEYV